MLEKEIKILEVDVEKLQKRLEELWAKKTFEGYIHDIYYDFPDDWKNKMEANKRLFRVRKKWDIHMYTIKRKRNKASEWWEKGVKIADEWEREITDVESFTKVLDKYGMKAVREKKKYRISYSLDWIEFDIDDYFYEDDRNLWLENHKQVDWGSKKLFKNYWVEYSWL